MLDFVFPVFCEAGGADDEGGVLVCVFCGGDCLEAVVGDDAVFGGVEVVGCVYGDAECFLWWLLGDVFDASCWRVFYDFCVLFLGFAGEFEGVCGDVDGEGVGELSCSFFSVVGVCWVSCGCSGDAS